MAEIVEIKSIKFSNSLEFPMVGLGTFRTSEDKEGFKKALKYALKIGYRHIDGAWLYKNEEAIGEAVSEAIQESNGQLKRSDIFYVSKCWNTFHSRDEVKKTLNDSLNKLGFDYIDLYLIHWPMGFKEGTGEPFPRDPANPETRLYSDVHYLETYQGLEDLVREGKVKSIGVSNFNISQLQEILNNCEIKPVNNQIELSPYLHNDKLVDFCQKNDIVVSAYGPVGAGSQTTDRPDLPILLENPTILYLSKKHNKTPAQICLRWAIQRNIVVLPKSITPSRILENAQIFDFTLSHEDMNKIKEINYNFRNYGVEHLELYYGIEITKHKFYPFNE